MDSYIYQTVGQDAIEFVAAAMELPLVRRVIQGSPIQQRLEYGDRLSLSAVGGDETEDLYELLLSVKVCRSRLVAGDELTYRFLQSQFPEIDAVSVGAILSDYQRLRVEQVWAHDSDIFAINAYYLSLFRCVQVPPLELDVSFILVETKSSRTALRDDFIRY
jgi:diphthamide synthase (EF-2-diphthine--ammonia ligase)